MQPGLLPNHRDDSTHQRRVVKPRFTTAPPVQNLDRSEFWTRPESGPPAAMLHRHTDTPTFRHTRHACGNHLTNLIEKKAAARNAKTTTTATNAKLDPPSFDSAMDCLPNSVPHAWQRILPLLTDANIQTGIQNPHMNSVTMAWMRWFGVVHW